MILKQGLSKLKSQPGTSLHFFFCEKGEDGKPLVLCESKAVTKEAEKESLAKAKSKVKGRGTMLINDAGDLCIKPHGSCPSSLQSGLEKAASGAGVRSYFVNIQIGACSNPDSDGGAESLGYSSPPPGSLGYSEAKADSNERSAPDAKATGYAPAGPRSNGNSPAAATTTGYAPAGPRSVGYSEGAVDTTGYTSPGLRPVGNSPAATIPSGYSPLRPRSVVDSDADTKEDGYSDADAKEDGYTDVELKEDGYSDDLDDAGNGNVATMPAKVKKTHADPLRKSSKLTAFLDLKDKTKARLAELENDPDADAEIRQLETRLAQVELHIASEIREQQKTGVSPKALEPEYAEESKKTGWKAWKGNMPPKPGETDEQVAARLKWTVQQVRDARQLAESEATIRRDFDATERKKNTLDVGGDGLVRDEDGDLVTQRTEFVADAETGDLVKFSASTTANGKTVTDRNGNRYYQEERVHHSSPLAGNDVAMAGSIEVENGKVKAVSNISGHYKPKIAEMLQFLEGLLRTGALLDKTWVDADGKELTGKPKEIYDSAIKVQKKLKKKAENGEEVSADLALIDKARAMLVKMGCGPSNRINPEAKVEFLEVTDDMTGYQIKMAAANAANNPIPAQDFLKGGDNKAQQAAKSNVHQEMANNPRFQEANEKAEKSAAKPTPKPTADAARKTMSDNLRQCEDLLAKMIAARSSGEMKPGGKRSEATDAEINELKITIVNLKKKLNEAMEPTNDDLKAMLRSVLELKTRLSNKRGNQAANGDLEPDAEEANEGEPAEHGDSDSEGEEEGLSAEEMRALDDGTMTGEQAEEIMSRVLGLDGNTFDRLESLIQRR